MRERSLQHPIAHTCHMLSATCERFLGQRDVSEFNDLSAAADFAVGHDIASGGKLKGGTRHYMFGQTAVPRSRRCRIVSLICLIQPKLNPK
jgi:hypothetical protein